jgi:hypothetical protein
MRAAPRFFSHSLQALDHHVDCLGVDEHDPVRHWMCVRCVLFLTWLQAWHLRPGSTHPCAQQFKSAVAAVPHHSKVLLLVGEIDCREGLLMSVENMKVGAQLLPTAAWPKRLGALALCWHS